MTVSLGKRFVAEAGAAVVTLMLASGTTPSTPFNIGIGTLGGLGDWLLGGQNLREFFPIYIIGPIVGAVLAAFLYDYLCGD